MLRDVRFALRTLVRQPVFTGVIALTLALGIGGSTALFSVVNAVLLRDLPHPESKELYLVRTVTPDGLPTGNVTPRELRPFYEVEKHPMVAAAALAWSQEVQIVGNDGKPHPTVRYGVTDQFFEVFRPKMALGRPFERGQRPGSIVITHQIWRDLFGSDPDIVGRAVSVEGGQRQVVGVTAADFEFPEDPGFLYLMSLGTAYDKIRGYRGFLRLRTGQTGDQLQAELTRLTGQLGPDPATGQPSVLVAQPFLNYVVGDLSTTVTILFGATGILFLIAGINVTNLLLSRTTVRAREMALREAVGAGRWRVMYQLLTESVLLSVLGGALGLAAAVIGVRVLLRMAPADLPRLDAVPIDRTVLLFAIVATVVTGILVALAPAWRLARNPLRTLVNEAGRGAPEGPARHRLLSTLVVTEIALAVLLVIGAGLIVRSYFNLTNTNPGFNADRVLTLFMYVPGRTQMNFKPAETPGGRPTFTGSYLPLANFYRDLEERIGGLAGVKAVASATTLPLDKAQYDPWAAFTVPGQPAGESLDAGRLARTRAVSQGFFDLMEVKLLAGRRLLSPDGPSAAGVAVVNDTFARRFFPGQNALGQRIRFPENPYRAGDVGFQLAHRSVDELEIVGVVDDVKYMALGEPPEPSIYMSRDQFTNRRQTILVKTTLDNAESVVTAIRSEIEAMDRLLTAEFSLYTPIVRASIASERLAATLIVVFGLMALALAAVGVYGLMSYSVTQRTGEMAVRSAMGASARQVLALVMGWGVRLAAIGVVIGVIGAIALRRVVAGQLYGITALDARVFVTAAAVLLGVAALACFVPAQRASRVDPAELLRQE